MNVIETIDRHLVTLPPERQAEALDFVLFLKQRQSRPANRAKAQPVRSLRVTQRLAPGAAAVLTHSLTSRRCAPNGTSARDSRLRYQERH